MFLPSLTSPVFFPLRIRSGQAIKGSLFMTRQPHAVQSSSAVAENLPNILDEVVAQLLHIWEQVLGVQSISPDQNYFDLGGDSSLAVQMFAQVEDVFKVKLPLATLYEAPTINELAMLVHGEVSATRWSWCTCRHSASLVHGPLSFLMHGAGGNVLSYRELSKHLGPDQPFYGLQALGLDGSCPHR